MYSYNFCIQKEQSIKYNAISYTPLESAVRPDIHPKSTLSHEGEPSGIWMTKDG